MLENNEAAYIASQVAGQKLVPGESLSIQHLTKEQIPIGGRH
jgi:hypothetical protein